MRDDTDLRDDLERLESIVEEQRDRIEELSTENDHLRERVRAVEDRVWINRGARKSASTSDD